MIVISPHFDDAVLGLGQTMTERPAGERLILCTIMGGRPAQYPDLRDRLHDWRCGFGETDDVVAVRRREDEAACRMLDAVPWHLPFVDCGYGRAAEVPEVRFALTALIQANRKPDEDVLVPLGLGHPDHVITRAAADDLATGFYEEAGYRLTHVHDVAAEVALLDAQGRLGETDEWAVLIETKLPLVECYRSQLLGLAALAVIDSIRGPERIRWVSPPEA